MSISLGMFTSIYFSMLRMNLFSLLSVLEIVKIGNENFKSSKTKTANYKISLKHLKQVSKNVSYLWKLNSYL